MQPGSPYIRLMRLNQPTGIWLLLWPCWWSIALASTGFPSLYTLALFAIGAVLMRSAGCIINDITDRKLDAQVERTRTRPLASGEITVQRAMVLLASLLLIALVVAMMLGKMVVLWAVLSLIPIAIYPWMKRISWWPQLFLGLTFNWGALMGWAAVRGSVEWPAIFLYVGGICWTLGYDTIYAHQDKKDDAKIGIKSTALRLGEKTKPIVTIFYVLAVIFWAAAEMLMGKNVFSYGLLFIVLLQLLWQVRSVNLDDPASCKRVFASNAWMGALLFISLLAK